MWAAVTLSEANPLPKAFHVSNHFSKLNMHLRILSCVRLIEMFDLSGQTNSGNAGKNCSQTGP